MIIKRVYMVISLILVCIFCSFELKNFPFCKADVVCSDILFEPQNSIELQGNKNIDLPYIAGLASANYNKAIFKRIDVYRFESDESKTLLLSKTVDKPLTTTYDDYYKNIGGEIKQVKGAEPSLVQDPITSEYSLTYENTLKEAIGYPFGYSMSWETNEYNSSVLNKCFESLPVSNDNNGSILQFDLTNVFSSMTYGSEYVLLLDGVFSYENQTAELHFERTVTIFYKPPLAWRSEEAFSILTNSANETSNWYKGDGHVHSEYSDGHKWIYNYCGTSEENPPYACRPTPENISLIYPRKHTIETLCYNPELQIYALCELPISEKFTLAHEAYNKGQMDWLIMTDHAGYLFSPAQNASLIPLKAPPRKPYPCGNIDSDMLPGDVRWFNNYRWECRTAEKYLPIAIIPQEEIAVDKQCKPWYESCTLEKYVNGGHMLNYNLLHGANYNEEIGQFGEANIYSRLSGRIADDTWGGVN